MKNLSFLIWAFFVISFTYAETNDQGAPFIRNFSTEEFQLLTTNAKKLRADIIRMTSVAKSGHPGGSMSWHPRHNSSLWQYDMS